MWWRGRGPPENTPLAVVEWRSPIIQAHQLDRCDAAARSFASKMVDYRRMFRKL